MTPPQFDNFITKQVELGHTSWSTLSQEYKKAYNDNIFEDEEENDKVPYKGADAVIEDPGAEGLCLSCE